MPKRDRPGSIRSQNSNPDRPEPKLLRAVEADAINEVIKVIEDAESGGHCNSVLLSIGLVRACDKNLPTIARYLLERGADANYVSGNKLPSLLRAAEYGHVEIANVLLDHNADVGIRNKKGRTALMTSAWKGHVQVVRTLIDRGAPINAVDSRHRNVLHNIAADKTAQECSRVILDILLRCGVDINARDENGRTPLHWTCVTGNEKLLRYLLAARANFEAVESRMKTALHLAVGNDRFSLTEILVQAGADVHANSDGGWTALHYACSKASLPLVELLIAHGADINAELLNGRTPLHSAAEAGNSDAATCLLRQEHIRRAVKDRFGNTPLLIAAQHARKDIVEMLAPWNLASHLLSEDEKEACHKFEATIVDFGNFKNENRVSRRSVYDLLYARDPKSSVSTMPKHIKATKLRWIHLPANNIAWCEALLTKRFIEEGANDIEGYKAIETSFTYQHRGAKQHSRFMRPMCSVVQRQADIEAIDTPGKPEPPVVIVHEPLPTVTEPDKVVEGSVAATPKPPPQASRVSDALPRQTNDTAPQSKQGHKSPSRNSTKAKASKDKSTRKDQPLKPSRSSTKDSVTQAGRKANASSCSIYLFMPYLHFETDERRQEMQDAIERLDTQRRGPGLHEDEILIRAHLTASTSFLHVRRTLDQFFYHNIDTQQRDRDQVVFRYQIHHRQDLAQDPKIFMVDQLWMWVIGKDLVVSSFPRRWKQPRNDPLNVLDGIIEDINSKTREPIQNVYELAMTIFGRTVGNFDSKGGDEFQFFDMFEGSLGAAMDEEAELFREFSEASKQASKWLHNHERPNRLSQPLFVDKLLDVGAETDLLAEVKDIRDELNILGMVLEYQQNLAAEFRKAVRNVYEQERSPLQLRKVERAFENQDKIISNPLKDIYRMNEQAERIYDSITVLLDLKQKHANAFEARFARDQAAGTIRQGRTILVFTIVTVIFLPLSFIAAFFAINLQNWPRPLTLSYVSEYIFGIGLGISIPCIVIAMTVDELGFFFSASKKWLRILFGRREERNDSGLAIQTLAIEEHLSIGRGSRLSREMSRSEKRNILSRSNERSPWQDANSRRRAARISWDVERGRK